MVCACFFSSSHVGGCDAGTRCNIHHGRAPSTASRTSCAMTSSSTPEVDADHVVSSSPVATAVGKCDAESSDSSIGSSPHAHRQPRTLPDSQLATDVWHHFQFDYVTSLARKLLQVSLSLIEWSDTFPACNWKNRPSADVVRPSA